MRMAKAEPGVGPRHTISSCLASAASTNVMWYTQCHKPTILEGFKFTPFMSIDYSTIFFVRLDDIGDEWHCPEPRSFQQPYDLPPPGSRPHYLRWKPHLPLEKHSRHLILLPQVLTSSTADGDHWLLQVEQQIQYETKCFLHAAHSILGEEKIVRC